MTATKGQNRGGECPSPATSLRGPRADPVVGASQPQPTEEARGQVQRHSPEQGGRWAWSRGTAA